MRARSPAWPKSVITFVENQLILGDRYRANYPVKLAIENGFINETQLADLTGKHRLLRIDQQLGNDRIELIHDRVVSVVRQARDQRKKTSEMRKIWAIAVLVVAGSGMSGFTFWVRNIDQLDLAKAQTELIDSKRSGDTFNAAGLVSAKGLGIVYIQFRDRRQLPQSRLICQRLIKRGYKVPEIETLPTGPSVTEVRYFDSSVGRAAGKIADRLKNEGIGDATAKMIPDY